MHVLGKPGPMGGEIRSMGPGTKIDRQSCRRRSTARRHWQADRRDPASPAPQLWWARAPLGEQPMVVSIGGPDHRRRGAARAGSSAESMGAITLGTFVATFSVTDSQTDAGECGVARVVRGLAAGGT